MPGRIWTPLAPPWGFAGFAEMNGKECDVIVNANDVHSDVQRLLHRVEEQPEVAKHILTPTEALNQVTDKTLLILVDHSKPSISISPELCQRLSQRLIVIDHHRRGEEFPENPMLVYIEPYASSTCELITEMFEYQPKNVPGLSKLEATAMLAGITVDTHSFSLRTGTRTFDAASYLRSVGADSTLVQELLKEDVNNFIQKNHLIETIEMVEPNMALCTGEEDEVYDPVVAAQAADTLLSLAGIEASFVIVKRIDGVIGISARSLGKVNVQVIMEKMGGGGHLSNAATQIKDSTIAQARQQLKDILTQLVAADEE
jgi:c-di-AMP phosphodiesterase-like protein